MLIGGLMIFMAGCPQIAVDDPCRSQCELGSGECEERPIEDFEDFDATAETWREDFEGSQGADTDGDGDQDIPFVYAGECADGTLFLFRGNGFTVEIHFFDAETEEFIALRTGTDVVDPVCFGKSYWPVRVECEGPILTEEIVGGGFEPGDPVPLPETAE